jgi:hypothetical protein
MATQARVPEGLPRRVKGAPLGEPKARARCRSSPSSDGLRMLWKAHLITSAMGVLFGGQARLLVYINYFVGGACPGDDDPAANFDDIGL